MFKDTLRIVANKEFASKDAIISDNGQGEITKLTYEQLWQAVKEVASTIRKAGIKHGERVLFVSENHLKWLPIFFGVASTGAILVPIDGNVAVERFKSIVADCNPAAVIISRRFAKRTKEFELQDARIATAFDLNFDMLMLKEQEKGKKSDYKVKPEDIAAIIYTSGTTGNPKGVMLSHAAFVNSASLGTKLTDYSTDDRMLVLLPFTHVFSLVDSGLVQLYNHSTLVICNSFNPVEIMQVLMKHSLNYILAVPRLAELLAMGLKQAPELKIPGLKMIVGGAAPRPEVLKLLMSHGVTTLQGYGMTETAAGIIIGKDAPIDSVGQARLGVKVKIDKPIDGIGELLISTPTIFSGVYGREDLQNELFDGEYFKTGDLGCFDKAGNLCIRGRAKEVIISPSGVNVYPDELEMRIGILGYAEEYVVFGYKEGHDEVPAIALLPRNLFFKEKSIGKVEEYIKEDIRKRCANWPEAERIRRVFIASGPLPRSASAKIQRFAVAALFADGETQTAKEIKPVPEITDQQLFNLFRQEVADFLNTDYRKIEQNTRLDDFMQLDSLGVIALLISLEGRFKVSFRNLIGTQIETFAEVFDYLTDKVSLDQIKIEKTDSERLSRRDLPSLLDYSLEAIEKRQNFIREFSKNEKFSLPIPEKPEELSGNIEGFIGMGQIPIGLCGPVLVKGDYAKGEFYVPVATTEGALVSSLSRGCRIISMAGGAEVKIIADSIVRTPIFVFETLKEMCEFTEWVEKDFKNIAAAAEGTTSHGKLLRIDPHVMNTKVVLRFIYSTGDASGQNMTTIATRVAIDYITRNYPGKIEEWFLESNLSGDKKVNAVNYITNRGKKVLATVRIPAQIISRAMRTTPAAMARFAELSVMTSVQTMSYGAQAHYANTFAAVYIAAGQDPACVAESATGFTQLEVIDGDLQISVTLPGIMVGTVGGGTRLATQNACLRMLKCAGAGGAKKFAEILAATILAGEISIIGAMAADEFTRAHARYGRASGMKKGKAN